MHQRTARHLWIICTLLILVFVGPLAPVSARTGGPETSGYVFIDSDEPGGPAYLLEDIATTGTPVTLGNDAVTTTPIAIGFPFHFFNADYNSIYICSNGFISFLSGQGTSATAAAVPNPAAPNAIIAGWWGDLKPNLGGTIAYKLMGSGDNQYLLIQYKDIPYALLTLNAKVSFEIKLFKNTNVIEVHYALAPSYSDLNGNVFPNTAGIENETGQFGLLYYNGIEGLASNLAVRYTPFVGVALEPSSIIGYAEPGDTIISKQFNLDVYNWIGVKDSFNFTINSIHGSWAARVIPESITNLDQGAGIPITVEVDFPANAAPAEYFEFEILVSSININPETGGPWTDSTHLIAAVPRKGYVFNQNQINFVDTQFHQDLGNPLNTEDIGQFLLSGGLSQDGQYLYGLLAGADNDQGGHMTGEIIIFNTEDMSLATDPILVGNDASFITQTPDGKKALVTSYGDGTLKILDLDPESSTHHQIIKTIDLGTGTQPIRIATSPCLNKAYITNKGGNSVSVVDLTTLDSETPVIRTISGTGLSQPWGIIIAPTGDKAYVANYGNTRISVIDTIQDTLKATWSLSGIASQSPEDLDLTPDGRWIYTAGTSSILAIDTTNPTAAPVSIPNVAQGLYSVDVFPSGFGPYAYISNGGSQTISVLDTSANQIIYTTPMEGAPSYASLFSPPTSCQMVQPVAAFSPTNATGQLGVPFTFINLSIPNPSDLNPITAEWNFGDGSETVISNDPNVTHTYTTPGMYTVTLSINYKGITRIATGTINFKPKASFTPNPAVLVNPGDIVNFINTTAENGTTTYRWIFGDGTADSTLKSPSHPYAQIGNYTVTLTATNSYGSDTFTGLAVFAPKADFSPKVNIIQVGDSITFTNASTGSTTLSYTWDFGDGSPGSTETSPSHTYSTAGSYTVSLTTTNTWGTSTTTGTVNFRPKAIFTPTANKIQVGDSVTFSNSSTGMGPLTYNWNFGDGSPASNALSPTHTYTGVGDYTVTLKVDNAYGSDTMTGKVDFPPIAAFTQSSNLIHTGESVTFTNESTGTATLTYLWDFGDGQTSQETNPVHLYPVAGAYTTRLTVTNSYGSSQATGQVNFAPKASFSPTNTVIQLGQAITFTNASTGTGQLSYQWDFGDGATSSLTSPSHTYTTAASYNVSLKVSNSFGDQTATGTVNFSPKASFTPTNKVIQLGDSITFTNTSSGTSQLSYLWDFGDGQTSTQTNPIQVYTAAGSYTVSLKVTNLYGNETITGIVNFAPKASFTPTSKVIQLGDSITFTSTSTGTAPLSYLWTFGDGQTSIVPNPSHTYATSGSYTVSLKVSNPYGNETLTGTVNFAPKTSFSPVNKVIQLGDAIPFTSTSSGTGPLNYLWDFGDGITSNLANPSHTYTTADSYTVSLKVTNAYGDETASGTVNFSPKTSFTPTNKVIQLGDTINFTNTSTGTAPLIYLWNFGDGQTSSAANPAHTFAAAGSYTVSLKVSNAYGNETLNGTVNFAPKTSFSPTNKVIQLGDSISFANSSTGTAPLAYEWNFGDGQTSNAASPTHTYNAAGSYTVSLKVSNDYGNQTASGTVNFSPKTSFTPTNKVIQLGNSITFTNTSTGTAPLNYLWDFGDGQTSTAANPVHTYTDAGAYTVGLKVTNIYGNQTASGTVNFAPKTSFSPTEKVIQLGDPITFTNSSTGTEPLSYEWDFGDGAISTLVSPTHLYTSAGSYSVRLKVTNTFGNETAIGTVNFAPKTSFSPTAKVIHLGEEIAFTNSSTGTTPLSYLWDFGDGATSTQAVPRHTYLTAGSYTVMLKVTNAFGDETLTGTVNFSPKTDFNYSPQDGLKPAMELTFTNQTTGTDPITCTWDFGDGSPTTTERNPKHVFTDRGVYQVQLSCHSDLYGDDSIVKPVAVDPFKVTLIITNDDGVDRVNAGEEITYQIAIINDGPDDIFDATVKDLLSDWLVNVNWTCSSTTGSRCSSSGAGNLIQDSADILSGGSLTYTIQAVVRQGVAGSLSNTVTLVLPTTYLVLNSDGDGAVHTTLVWGNIFLPLVSH